MELSLHSCGQTPKATGGSICTIGGYLDFTAANNAGKSVGVIVKALGCGVPLEQITLSSDANGSFGPGNKRGEIIGIKGIDSSHNTV